MSDEATPGPWVRITPLGNPPCDTRRCEVPGCDGPFTHQVCFDSPDERVKVNVGSILQPKFKSFPQRRCVFVCSDHRDSVLFNDDEGVTCG